MRPRTTRLAAIVASVLVFASCSTAEPGPTVVSSEPPAPSSTTTEPTSSTAAPIVTSTTPPTTSTTAVETTTTSSTTTTTLPPAPLQGIALETIASDLHQPTSVTSPPDDERLFVVERRGRIRIVADEGLLETPFLDIEEHVNWAAGIEQGMLGLAFHPNYADNGRFFVYYVGEGDARRLSEFSVSSDPNVANPASEEILLTRPQPTDIIRHYAGHLEFGPDGYLYAALGDGAAPELNGQDPNTVFGAILRLDVDAGTTYAIPADNPFVDGGGAGEVWAFGLRNPWQFSIDSSDRLMYIGDVGQDSWEEINTVSLDAGGVNFGWPDTEGSRCFLLSGCNLDDYTLPTLEYSHSAGCSVSGGRVYRGKQIPELQGHYFYADWCKQWVRSFRLDNGVVTDEADWTSQLAAADQVQAFGEDTSGELYLVNFDGDLFKIVPVR